MNISINDVKKLRELTGFGIQNCKDALVANNGDFEAAIKELRAKYADKYKSAELDIDSVVGRLFMKSSSCGRKIKFGFVKAKSDIVAISDELLNLMSTGLNLIQCNNSFDKENTESVKNSDSFKKILEDLLVYYREPLIIETISGYEASSDEVLGSYFHNQSTKSIDETVSAQKGAIIALKFSGELDSDSKSKLKDLADLIAMSMIGNESANVLFKEELNQENVNAFKEKSCEELKASGKPENVIGKIVEGQMKKFFEANTLICSPLINPGKLEWLKNKDQEISIEDAIKKASEVLKTNIEISYYRIFRVIK